MKLDRQKLLNHIELDKINYIKRLELPTTYDPNKPTILFADDFDSILVFLRRLSKRMNLTKEFNVVYSNYSDASIKILNEVYANDNFNIDILITDITFGGGIDLGNGDIQNITGVKLASILKEANPELIYHFITGHMISPKATPNFYKEFEELHETRPLDAYTTYKDIPLSTNRKLLTDLLLGTGYEELLNICIG